MRRDEEESGMNADANANDPDTRAQADWVAADAINSIAMEKTLHDDETEEQMSRRLLREAAPQITIGVIHTALHGQTDRVRLDAQKYVLDRVLGKIGDEDMGSNKTPMELMFEALTKNAEDYANANHGSTSDTQGSDQDK